MGSMIVPVVFVIYVLVTVFIGTFSGKGLDNFDEFAVMNRKATAPLIIATLSGTIIGAGATLGTSGMANSSGLVAIFALAIPWGLTLLITGYLGNPLWELGKKIGANTLGDVTGHFYGKPSQVTIGLLGLLMTLPALGAQLVAAGKIFSSIMPISYTAGVLIAGATIILYCTIAGMRGVIITDWIQFVTLMLVIPATALYLTYTVGMQNVVTALEPKYFSWHSDWSISTLISLAVLMCLSEIICPWHAGRLLAGDKPPSKRAMFASITSVTYMICAVMIGLIGVKVLPEVTGESIIPQMLVKYLPAPIAAAGAAALFAVLMSSSNSILNAESVILVCDIWGVFKKLDNKKQLFLGRIFTIVFGGIAIIFALAIPGIIDLLILGYYFWAPCIIFCIGAMLLTKKRNFSPYAPPVAMIGTAIFIIVWHLLGNPYGWEPLFPSLIVNLILLLVTHYITKGIKPSKNFFPEQNIELNE